MATISFELRIDRPVAQALALDVAEQMVTDTTRRVFNRANILTPVDTGRLRAGNMMRVRREPTQAIGEVFNETSYAAAVHDGSPVRIIRPRAKKALRFVIDGEVIYARKVVMPARKGRPWILRAVREIAVPDGYLLSDV